MTHKRRKCFQKSSFHKYEQGRIKDEVGGESKQESVELVRAHIRICEELPENILMEGEKI